MNTWNIRVLVTEEQMIGGPNELVFAFHEVHYTDGRPEGCTKNPIRVSGDSLESLEWYVDKMQEALKKPILWGDHRWPQEYKK
jgi:hypothetical protein